MRALIDKLSYSQNWNIGFCEQTYSELIEGRRLRKIKWMRHGFMDRWFADPFLYRVSESEIIVFVEECPIINPKGIICELVLDRKTYKLKERYVMLELDTHLSYPAIFRENGKVYVYPENGKSGQLNIYEYDEGSHRLIYKKCILNEAVADATIIKRGDKYFLVCTKYPKTQTGAYLYASESILGPFVALSNMPVESSMTLSRPGGNWFPNAEFRPAQICKPRYGSGLSILNTDTLFDKLEEKFSFELSPSSWRYNLGLHTINNHNGLMVIDGYGYKYPVWGRLIMTLRKFKSIITHIVRHE